MFDVFMGALLGGAFWFIWGKELQRDIQVARFRFTLTRYDLVDWEDDDEE